MGTLDAGLRCPICGQDAAGTGSSNNNGSRSGDSGSCPLQPDWADEHRMGYLMSGGSDAERDSDKLAFWSAAVKHYCELSSDLEVHPSRLQRALSRNGNSALGLEDVLRLMATQGQLISKHEILAPATPPSWSAWLVRTLVIRPLSAAVGYSGGAKGAGASASYVSRHVMENLARTVSEYVALSAVAGEEHVALLAEPGAVATPSAHSVRAMLARAAGAAAAAPESSRKLARPLAGSSVTAANLLRASDADAELIVSYMVATGRASRDGRVISFAGRAPVTDVEKHMLFLRCTVDQLRAEADRLQAQADSASAEALWRKKAGQAQMALSHMRRRKQATQVLERRLESLETLERCLAKVEGMRVDENVLEAQELAARTMKAFRKDHNLTAERIEDAIDDLAEELEAADKLSAAMAEIGVSAVAAAVSEDDLEEELAVLEADAQAERIGGIGMQAQRPQEPQQSNSLAGTVELSAVLPAAPAATAVAVAGVTAATAADDDDDARLAQLAAALPLAPEALPPAMRPPELAKERIALPKAI